jgi:hypothetical protein
VLYSVFGLRANGEIGMKKREYGPSDFKKMLTGLRVAAERFQRIEFEKIVNPAPVQMHFPFLEEKSNG